MTDFNSFEITIDPNTVYNIIKNFSTIEQRFFNLMVMNINDNEFLDIELVLQLLSRVVIKNRIQTLCLSNIRLVNRKNIEFLLSFLDQILVESGIKMLQIEEVTMYEKTFLFFKRLKTSIRNSKTLKVLELHILNKEIIDAVIENESIRYFSCCLLYRDLLEGILTLLKLNRLVILNVSIITSDLFISLIKNLSSLNPNRLKIVLIEKIIENYDQRCKLDIIKQICSVTREYIKNTNAKIFYCNFNFGEKDECITNLIYEGISKNLLYLWLNGFLKSYKSFLMLLNIIKNTNLKTLRFGRFYSESFKIGCIDMKDKLFYETNTKILYEFSNLDGFIPVSNKIKKKLSDIKPKDFLERYFDNSKYSDVDFILVDENNVRLKTFKLHRFILKKYFSVFKLKESDVDAFEVFLRFLYSGTIKNTKGINQRRIINVFEKYAKDLVSDIIDLLNKKEYLEVLEIPHFKKFSFRKNFYISHLIRNLDNKVTQFKYTPDDSDIKIKLVGTEGQVLKEFPVHRVILCSRSEYMRNMLEKNFVESTKNEITIQEDDVYGFEYFLNFLYNKVFDFNLNTKGPSNIYGRIKELIDIIKISDKYMCDELKDIAEIFLLYEIKIMRNFAYDFLNIENFLDFAFKMRLNRILNFLI